MATGSISDKISNEKTTIYLDPKLKKSVQYYALRDDRSLSDIINQKLFEYLEDMADLAAIKDAKDEPTVPFNQVLKELGLDLNEIRHRIKKERPKAAKKT